VSSNLMATQSGKDVKGVRQRFNVHREEDELIGPLQTQDASAGDPASMVNVDVVSEKIDVDVNGGVARVTVRVRCERIVPIRGSSELFKKSAVIVTRLVEIDLTVSEERRRLYERVLERTSEQQASSGAKGKLGTEDTFALYKVLMGLADSDQTASKERLHIERLLDEQRTSPAVLVDGDEILRAPAACPVPRHPPPPPPPRPSVSATTQLPSTQVVQSSTSEAVQRQRTEVEKSSDTVTSLMY